VEFLRVINRRFQSLALLGEDMDQYRNIAVLREFEILGQGIKVVSINRAEVTQSEFLEQGRLHEKVLGFAFPL
jgi:hypothetical protein